MLYVRVEPKNGERMVEFRLGVMMMRLLSWKTIAFGLGLLLVCVQLSRADFPLGEEAYLAEDYEAAMRIWAPLAAQGDADAQNMVGFMYRWGQGVEQDFEKARQWYRSAADQGSARAQTIWDFCIAMDWASRKNYATAFRWFLRAAEQGNAAGAKSRGADVLQRRRGDAGLRAGLQVGRARRGPGNGPGHPSLVHVGTRDDARANSRG